MRHASAQMAPGPFPDLGLTRRAAARRSVHRAAGSALRQQQLELGPGLMGRGLEEPGEVPGIPAWEEQHEAAQVQPAIGDHLEDDREPARQARDAGALPAQVVSCVLATHVRPRRASRAVHRRNFRVVSGFSAVARFQRTQACEPARLRAPYARALANSSSKARENPTTGPRETDPRPLVHRPARGHAGGSRHVRSLRPDTSTPRRLSGDAACGTSRA
jgi:hypothetical protein